MVVPLCAQTDVNTLLRQAARLRTAAYSPGSPIPREKLLKTARDLEARAAAIEEVETEELEF